MTIQKIDKINPVRIRMDVEIDDKIETYHKMMAFLIKLGTAAQKEGFKVKVSEARRVVAYDDSGEQSETNWPNWCNVSDFAE